MPLVRPVTPLTLVGIVNDFGCAPREAAGLLGTQAPTTAIAGHPAVGHTDLIMIADRLWPIFDAAEVPRRRSLLFNRILRDARLCPTVLESGAIGWRTTRTAAARQLEAACALALAVAVDSYGWKKIGTCASADCVDAYLDVTRGTSRKYCSVTCLNRSKVRAHRARQSSPRQPAVEKD